MTNPPPQQPHPAPQNSRFAPPPEAGRHGRTEQPAAPGEQSGPHPGPVQSAQRQTHSAPPENAFRLTEEDARLRTVLLRVGEETAKAVVGQEAAVRGILIGLLVQGHVLLEGVPGVAKTLLVRSVAQALDLTSQRLQFTPDLMPGDVTGSLVYDAKTGDFTFREGPVFTHLMVADEINRTPPKTQSALLEAMEERQVSTDGITRRLPSPFLVAATQNPVEHEGTYPLPEAQLDRFLFKLVLDLPDRDTEFRILARHAAGFDSRRLRDVGIERVAGPEQLLAAGARVRQIHVAPEVLAYIVDIVQATRRAPSLSLGVSPRGATRLLAAAQAQAWLAGRGFVTPDDVKSLVPMTFRHRITLRPEAQMEGADVDRVLASILDTVAVPR
ncbi:MoxR family ATPase [Brevibacterium salitolerans]|uniref:MoxR family ATPase n=1 Tax=Brevibacterium salitolerans TaxID=1403566 RepID=A0ABP5HXH6_9MICO